MNGKLATVLIVLGGYLRTRVLFEQVEISQYGKQPVCNKLMCPAASNTPLSQRNFLHFVNTVHQRHILVSSAVINNKGGYSSLVPLFDIDNYLIWSNITDVALKGCKLWEVVEDS